MQKINKLHEFLEKMGIQAKGNFMKQFKANQWLEKFQKWIKKSTDETFTI